MEPTGKPFAEQPALHANAPHRAAMLTHPGNFKGALLTAKKDPKKTLFGVAHGIASPFVTKILAMTQPDFIWIDYEHGVFGREALYEAVQAAQHHSEGKSMVIVRVSKGDPTGLATALDAGAGAIVMPHTETAEEVREMIKEVFYPPLGQRSFSPWTFVPNIASRSLYPDDAWNMKNSNNHVALIAQIESVKGLDNMDEICAVPGLSGLMFGPGDFSADAGIDLRLDAPPPQAFVDAMGRFVGKAKEYDLPLFGAAQNPAMIPMMIQQGYAAIAVAFDMWHLAQLVHKELEGARKIVSELPEAGAEEGKAANGEANGHTVPVKEGESS